MNLFDEQWEFLKDVARLIFEADDMGYKLTGGELYRPQEMQEIYYKQGKTRTLKSRHSRRLAIDFNISCRIRDKWILTYDYDLICPLSDFWESLSPKNKWGGNWKSLNDVGHFERRAYSKRR